MRKIILALVAATAVIVPASAASATTEPKVYVCHWANGHPHVINIAVSALSGHFTNVNPDNPAPGHELDLYFGTNLSNDEEDSCSGAQGPAGKDGKDGKDGKNGINCYDGLDILNPSVEDCRGKDGVDGTDGKDGVDGKDGNGVPGPQGPAGPVGPAGKDGASVDTSRIEQLERIVTELNNRLFILEHAAPAEAPVAATPEAAQPHGELPHTGSTTMPILFIGGMLTLLGFALRRAVRMNRG